MPLQWKKTTLYPYLPCSRILVESCARRLAPLLANLPDVPVRLLAAVLSSQLGPVQLQRLLSVVLPPTAPAFEYARRYLRLRSLSLIPALLSSIGFAAFRGLLDNVTPLRVSLASNARIPRCRIRTVCSD